MNALVQRIGIMSVFCGTLFGGISFDAYAAEIKEDPRYERSLLMVRVADGKSLLELNPHKLMTPASVTKIITAACALSKWGPAHTFKTRVFIQGDRNGEAIRGSLIIKGDGDPLLVSEKLWQFAADVRHMGISKITGDIIIDQTLFGDESRDESREKAAAKSIRAYDAPVSALGVNFNTMVVAAAPAPKVGKPALIELDPYNLRQVTIINQTKTTGIKSKTQLNVSRKEDGSNAIITVSGTIAADDGVQKIYRSVGDQDLAAGEYFRAFLLDQGIKVEGKVKVGVTPDSAQPLIEIDGYELRRITAGLSNFSNNYIADVLLKRLGAAFPATGDADGKGQGTFKHGVSVLEKFLKEEVGIKEPFVLNDGSGLSSDNRLSAAQLVALLIYMEKQMEVYPDFIAGLPAFGWDGTLKKRLKAEEGHSLHGKIRAKTGTLNEPSAVATLAGYFRHPIHGMVAFAILDQTKAERKSPNVIDLRQYQDELFLKIWDQL